MNLHIEAIRDEKSAIDSLNNSLVSLSTALEKNVLAIRDKDRKPWNNSFAQSVLLADLINVLRECYKYNLQNDRRVYAINFLLENLYTKSLASRPEDGYMNEENQIKLYTSISAITNNWNNDNEVFDVEMKKLKIPTAD